jgi:hypothetical protein
MSQPTTERTQTPYMRGIPEPTSGPLWAGFGLTLMFAGLVTNWTVSVVGLIACIAGFIAWARGCFPEEALEELEKGSDIITPAPALATKPATERVMLPVQMHRYRSGVWGGLAGGVAMAIAAVAWGLLREGSVWLPINLLAGVFVPSVDAENVAMLKSFQPGIFAVGDVNTYPGKKKLIVCGFHEATLAAYDAAERLVNGRKVVVEYTTTSTRLHALLRA